MHRQNIAAGTPWESIVGYSRAIRVGSFVYVSGTTAINETGAVVILADGFGYAVKP